MKILNVLPESWTNVLFFIYFNEKDRAEGICSSTILFPSKLYPLGPRSPYLQQITYISCIQVAKIKLRKMKEPENCKPTPQVWHTDISSDLSSLTQI